jgi:hypothetical protein
VVKVALAKLPANRISTKVAKANLRARAALKEKVKVLESARAARNDNLTCEILMSSS